jgi:hypothetical protein
VKKLLARAQGLAVVALLFGRMVLTAIKDVRHG